jgi:superfamily I DNA/RNA helicase
VDEVQDLSTVEIELVAACTTSQENGLFLVGDPEQQVYPKEHNLRKAGVNVAARRFFRKNYRNPRQILEAALELLRLHGQQGIDPDDEKLVMLPEYAKRESAKPLLVKCLDDDDQMIFLVNFVNRRLTESEAAMCLILCSAREDDDTKISDYAAQLQQKGLATEPLFGIKKVQPKTVYLSGLETVKGFEFSRVFIVGIGEQFPAPDLPQEEAWRDVRRLYVALTRARDEVILTYTDGKSRCLVGLEAHLSETTSEEQVDRSVFTANSDQQMAAVAEHTADAMRGAITANVLEPTPDPVIRQLESADIVEFFRNSNLEVHDKRDRGGCLWVVGGPGLQSTMSKLKSAGFRFSFTPNGSRTTRHRPAWYLK